MCKVSIVMPVYNKEKYIEKSIRSILAQTFVDFELIIVDDGSTDRSLSICKQFHDSRIKVHHIENGGVSNARNLGISLAKGEYVTFIDGDDTVSIDYLEKLYYPDKDMIIGGLTMIDSFGEEIKTICPNHVGEIRFADLIETFYTEQSNTGIYGFVSSKLVRRAIIAENNLQFDKDIKLAEDYDFFLSVYANINTIYFVKEAGYYYEQATENNAISMCDEKIDFFRQMLIRDKALDLLKTFGNVSDDTMYIYNEEISAYVYTILLLNSGTDYRSFKDAYLKIKQMKKSVFCHGKGAKALILRLYNRGYINSIWSILVMRNKVKAGLKGAT